MSIPGSMDKPALHGQLRVWGKLRTGPASGTHLGLDRFDQGVYEVIILGDVLFGPNLDKFGYQVLVQMA
jgi:hypothetical protein